MRIIPACFGSSSQSAASATLYDQRPGGSLKIQRVALVQPDSLIVRTHPRRAFGSQSRPRGERRILNRVRSPRECGRDQRSASPPAYGTACAASSPETGAKLFSGFQYASLSAGAFGSVAASTSAGNVSATAATAATHFARLPS